MIKNKERDRKVSNSESENEEESKDIRLYKEQLMLLFLSHILNNECMF